MIRWRLYDNNPARDVLEQLLHAASQQQATGRGEPMPINVHQSEQDLFVEAALPGVKPDDIDISYHDGLLSLRAHSEVAETEYYHQEMRSIEYLRQVMLPVECRFEEAEASLENGILRVRIPKQRARPLEKIHIQVNRSGGPKTIDAARGVGYREVRAAPRAKSAATPKKAGSGPAPTRKPSTGARRRPPS